MTFNIINALKYPNEDIANYSLISSWNSLIHKQLINSKDGLENELGDIEKKELGKDLMKREKTSEKKCFQFFYL